MAKNTQKNVSLALTGNEEVVSTHMMVLEGETAITTLTVVQEPEYTLPEGWDEEMVAAHIISAETIEMDKKLAAEGLVMYPLPKETRETPENLIVPAGIIGSKERWFIKKNLKAVTKMDDGQGFWIVASARQLKDRGITL